MPELTQPDGSHERDTVEGKWLEKFFPAFMRVTSDLKIQGFDVGHNYFEFVDGNKTITITFKSKWNI